MFLSVGIAIRGRDRTYTSDRAMRPSSPDGAPLEGAPGGAASLTKLAKTILKREKSLPNLTKLNLSKCKNNIKLFVYEIILGNVLKGQLEEINFSESTTDNKALDIL